MNFLRVDLALSRRFYISESNHHHHEDTTCRKGGAPKETQQIHPSTNSSRRPNRICWIWFFTRSIQGRDWCRESWRKCSYHVFRFYHAVTCQICWLYVCNRNTISKLLWRLVILRVIRMPQKRFRLLLHRRVPILTMNPYTRGNLTNLRPISAFRRPWKNVLVVNMTWPPRMISS